MSSDPFEATVRAALRAELTRTRVGAAAPQIRGRIAVRERGRHLRRVVVAMMGALLAIAMTIPVIGGLILLAPVAPSPYAVQPAAVVAIEGASGDLILSQAWPDGRVQVVTRYLGALDLLREATGDPALVRLPNGTVATVGTEDRIAVALPAGDILVFAAPDQHGFVTRVVDEIQVTTWLGWAGDGRLVAVTIPHAAENARLRVRLVVPDGSGATDGELPFGAVPLPVLDGPAILTWSDDDRIVGARVEAGMLTRSIGTIDVMDGQPTFDASTPGRVRVATGLEPSIARDARPTTWSPDAVSGSTSVGFGAATDADPDVHWFVAAAGERVFDVAQDADGRGLVAFAAHADGGGGHLVAIDAPGSWREAVSFSGTAARAVTAPGAVSVAPMRIVGIAPDGHGVAVRLRDALVVGDVLSGESINLPAGTVFAGWPSGVVDSEAAPAAPACVTPSAGVVASIALSAPGPRSPGGGSAVAVVGSRSDSDPWRRDQLAEASPLSAPLAGPLVLALPAGTCVEAFHADAIETRAAADAAPVVLGVRTAGTSDVAGLLEIPAPDAGDWVLRVRLWLTGASTESILLYHVRAAG